MAQAESAAYQDDEPEPMVSTNRSKKISTETITAE